MTTRLPWSTNHSVTQSESVTVHTIDRVASMVAYWLKASKDKPGRSDIAARCWNLSDAYNKQIHFSDDTYERGAFLAVFNPRLKQRLFSDNVSCFSARDSLPSSVFDFEGCGQPDVVSLFWRFSECQ